MNGAIDYIHGKQWREAPPRPREQRCLKTQVIARDRLTSCLLEEIREKYSDAVTVRFGVQCATTEWHEAAGGTGATLTLVSSPSSETMPAPSSDAETLSADFVVAADGVKSAVRDALENDMVLTKGLSGRALKVNRFPRTNEFVYKVLSFRLDAGWR